MDRIVIDQSKIRIDEDLVRRGAAPFPRPLSWWQRMVPIWVDAAETDGNRIVLTPSGKVADGSTFELTPATVRSELKAIRRYLDGREYLDFSDAIEA